jgi:serine phosphatase RsbU (regulator of sigma subunit)
VVVVLVLRFVRSREDEERLASELAAARAVQHVLIPDEIPAVPGYQLECVYRPAGEVGGDFFQILPMDGGALVAIGDVSGKGMPAAMTVSLLVGTLRAMAQSTTRPSELLGSLNQLLMGRTSGGFVTCLVLRVNRNGAVSAANAGHIAPYLNGKEVALENGLPLGMDGSTQYTECSLQLNHAEELTLITDGVVEARNCHGELFGFDRTAGLTARSAEDIASAAQAFGQTDDITVLRLRRDTEAGEANRLAEAARLSPAPA